MHVYWGSEVEYFDSFWITRKYFSLSFFLIEDVPKQVGPNLLFADDDQQRSRPGRLAKHPAFGLLLSPAGYLTPPVDFLTDGRKARCFASRLFDPSG